jgi:imidazolonepropionase-like amidohydrolase/ABC-type polysaccharide/polyol phosphate export permease
LAKQRSGTNGGSGYFGAGPTRMRAGFTLLWRNIAPSLKSPAFLLFSYAIPLGVFFALASLFHAGEGAGFFVGAALAVGVLSHGLWSAWGDGGADSENDEGFESEPASPTAAWLVEMAAACLLYLPLMAAVAWLAQSAYRAPAPRQWPALVILTLAGVCAFRALGLALAAASTGRRDFLKLRLLFSVPMLLLGGALAPLALLPQWLRAVAEFVPLSYLTYGFQGAIYGNESLRDDLPALAALALLLAAGVLTAMPLFRQEDADEPDEPRSKAWLALALCPFVFLGGYNLITQQDAGRSTALYREFQRSRAFLIHDARVFTGATVLEHGSVLVKHGKIAAVYAGSAPDGDALNAEVVEAAGKTLLPGLIDAHVHLVASGGVSADGAEPDPQIAMRHAAAALLYGGVTTARSAGDPLDLARRLRREIASGARLGARLYLLGPVFTIEARRGAEFLESVPPGLRERMKAQSERTPRTPEEASQQVKSLRSAGVDGLKAILEAGWGGSMLADRLDLLQVRSVAEEARARKLPLAVHTGDALDVADAVEIGANSIEHGAWRGELPDSLLERMARQGVYYDPTLSAAEAQAFYYQGDATPLNGALTQQAASYNALHAAMVFVGSHKSADAAKAAQSQQAFEQARANLQRVWRAGIPLVMGTDAGAPLVFHGASLHHELQLWVKAGIPPQAALEAATVNAARMLGAANRIGAIRKGMDADLLLVEGNPLEDITATERIALVVLRGERIRREELFEQR